MITTHHASPLATAPLSEGQMLHRVQTTLKFLFGLVPIVAGADKFTNLLANWETYLNPIALRLVPVSATWFMHLVGIVEIAAGILVFVRPRFGAFVVMAWLLGVAFQL